LELRLDPGESEAIAIALEVGADRILIDERRARKVASEFSLRPSRTSRRSVEAKQQKLLEQCKPVLDEVIQTAGFWIGERLYAQFLIAIHESE